MNYNHRFLVCKRHIYQIFLTLDPTKPDPYKTEHFVTQPNLTRSDPTRPMDGPDPCPTVILTLWPIYLDSVIQNDSRN